MPQIERIGIALAVVLLVALPTALHGWPTTLRGNLFAVLVLGGGFALMWWRSHPRVASMVALGLFMAALALGGWFPDTGVALYSLSFAVLALGWSGRAAWLVALCGVAYLVPFYYLAEISSWVAALMFTVCRRTPPERFCGFARDRRRAGGTRSGARGRARALW